MNNSFHNVSMQPPESPPSPPSSTSPSSSIHLHCQSCFNSLCEIGVEFSSGVQFSCKMTFCEFCGISLHECKLADHLNICRSVRRPCLNAIHGCPHLVKISEQAEHLKVCPANVIVCTMSWNRGALARHDRPLFLAGLENECNSEVQKTNNFEKFEKKPETTPKINKLDPRRTHHLDVALATRDQESLFKYIHTQTEGSIWPICHNPYVHNLDAINVNSITESTRQTTLNSITEMTNSVDSLQAFENAYSSFIKSSNFSNSDSYRENTSSCNYIDSSIQADNNSSVFDEFSTPKSDKNNSSNSNETSIPAISATIYHPTPKMFFSKAFKPKQFVSRGTDPMLEIPLTKQDTQMMSDYSLLGPEACLHDVDFCERFFRMIGCDNTQHNFNPRWTRGHRTFEAAAQTFPYPAVVLKTDIQNG